MLQVFLLNVRAAGDTQSKNLVVIVTNTTQPSNNHPFFFVNAQVSFYYCRGVGVEVRIIVFEKSESHESGRVCPTHL